MQKPFFSVIIPCYNDGRYKTGTYLDRLLDSLTKQWLDKGDLEVILSDDHSPVKFDELIEKYKDELNLKYILTDYNFAPGNTREKGVSIATGEWLAFADHDDMYYPGALKHVKDEIILKGEKYFAFTDFDGVDTDGKKKKTYKCTLNWCHGKFYNHENLWKANDIHFIKDLRSHEDIAICSQVKCTLSNLGIHEATYIPFSSYAWTDNPESVSHSKYTLGDPNVPRSFLEVFFADYIASTGWIYLERFNARRLKMAPAVDNCIGIILYCYFYIQSFLYTHPEDYVKENLRYAGDFVVAVMKAFNLDEEEIYRAISAGGAKLFYDIRNGADPGCGRYIPQQSFKEWLQVVTNESKSAQND